MTLKVIVLGALSAVAEQTARLYAAERAELLLVARDRERLDAVAADLRVRGATRAEVLALDFRNRGPATLALLQRLDRIVTDAGGRIYPAKDARMGPAMFEQGYQRLGEFRRFRDPLCQSDFARRMML